MVQEFINTYFVQPILTGSGYNIYNTAVYALLLIVAAYAVFRLLQKLNIKIDRRFVAGVIPFIAMGGILRALEDFNAATGAAKNVFLITPLIYLTIFVVALVGLLIARALHSRIEYHKTWFVIGAAVDVWAIAQLRLESAFALNAVIALTVFWILVIYAAKLVLERYRGSEFFSNENVFLLNAHMFDASTTFVALQYFPYFEQHVLPGFLIGIFGPAAMFALKLVVITAVLYVLDKDMPANDQRTFIKLIVLILGLAPGLRNFLRIIAGV